MNASLDASALARTVEGCLLGTAIGDSLGLPFENLSRRSVAKLLRGPLEQSLVLGRGLVSDDTELTVMSMQSLLDAGGNAAAFKNQLASRLQWWLLSLPPGVGGATAQSILKLWLGKEPSRSGVFSAGNGAATRTAILGVLLGDEPLRMRDFVRESTRITHSDPRAYEAALAVAVAASCAARLGPSSPREALTQFLQAYGVASHGAGAMLHEVALLKRGVQERWTVQQFANALDCRQGVSGYALHTVPVALYAWICHPTDFAAGVEAVVRCGGDTDSTAAIVGALVGAGVGREGIPAHWLEKLAEWPRSVRWMQRLAAQLAQASLADKKRKPSRARRLLGALGWPVRLIRNLAMWSVVLYVFARRTTCVLARKR